MPATDAPVVRRDGRGPRPARPPSDYSVLLRRVQEAGLTGRRYGYYAVKASVLGVLLAGVWVGVAVVGDTWAQVGLGFPS